MGFFNFLLWRHFWFPFRIIILKNSTYLPWDRCLISDAFGRPFSVCAYCKTHNQRDCDNGHCHQWDSRFDPCDLHANPLRLCWSRSSWMINNFVVFIQFSISEYICKFCFLLFNFFFYCCISNCWRFSQLRVLNFLYFLRFSNVKIHKLFVIWFRALFSNLRSEFFVTLSSFS